MRWLRVEPVGIVAVAVAAVVTGFAVPALAAGAMPAEVPVASVVSAAAGIPALAMGVLILSKRPGNMVGRLLALAALAAVVLGAMDAYSQAAAHHGLPISHVAVALTQGSWMLYYLPWAWLMLVFPTGRLRTRFDRAVAVSLPATVLLFNVLAAVGPADYMAPWAGAPHVLGTLPGSDVVAGLLLPLFMVQLLACVWALVRRFRSATPAEGMQLRWLAAASVAVPAALLLCWLGYWVSGSSDVAVVGLVLIYVALPLAVAVAVLRAELFDVDRVLVTGLVVTGLGAVVLAVGAAASALAGTALAGTALGGGAAAAAVTAVLILAVLPLRRKLERGLSLRLFPDRENALRAVESLEQRVFGGQADPEELEDELRAALRDPTLRLGYFLPGTEILVDKDGAPTVPAQNYAAITLAGNTIGTLTRGTLTRHGTRPPGVVLARMAVMVEMVRLRLELAAALAEVEASRSRILTAGYAERQRLERDLHDGAQQRLVALGMTLRLAQRHLGPDQRDLHGVMDGAVAELGTAVAELRQLAHGLRPSSLDAGLPAALEHLCNTAPLTVDLDLTRAGPRGADIPESVGTTAYFIASEAVANAAKHAQASRVGVCLEHDGSMIRIGVTDDGAGGALIRAGGGLAGLLDRVRAQGGTLRVVSREGHGTLVEALLPCA